MRRIVIIFLFIGLLGCHKTDVITRFSEENEMQREFYVYPSTLRMANLEENEEFNSFIKDFREGQYFIFDKNNENKHIIEDLKSEMQEEGFEEAMTLQDRERNVSVYIQETKVPKIAAIIEEDSTFNIIQIKGIVNITKLPGIIQNYNSDDFFNVIDFFEKDKNSYDHGPHSQD